jgi:hypothetical protein
MEYAEHIFITATEPSGKKQVSTWYNSADTSILLNSFLNLKIRRKERALIRENLNLQ